MGSVLAFQPREAATDRKPPAPGATAAIVIFPGIRYERRDEADAHAAAIEQDRLQRDKPRPRH